MKKIGLIIAAGFGFILVFSAPAHAVTSVASPYFDWDPATSGPNDSAHNLGLPWYGTNAPGATPANNWAGDHYATNVYWNFGSNPVGSANPGPLPNAQFFGPVNQADSVSFSGNTAWTKTSTGNPSSFLTHIGVTSNSTTGPTTGSAAFTLGNPAISGSMNYFMEASYSMTGGAGGPSFITFTLPGISNSDFFINGVSQGALGTAGTSDTYTVTATNTAGNTFGTLDAWFKFNTAPSSETLDVDFSAGPQGGNSYLTSLHIATTPEPIAVALFVVGVTVLLLFGSRRLNFVRA